MTVGETLTKGATIYARVGAALFVFIALIACLLLGWWAMSIYKDPFSKKVSGIVVDVKDCATQMSNKSVNYNCILTISYNVNGNVYTLVTPYSGNLKPYVKQVLSLRYLPSDPAQSKLDNAISPFLLLAIAAVILILATINAVIVFTSDEYAAFSGSVGGASAIMSNLRG
jgi:hypothetical protein